MMQAHWADPLEPSKPCCGNPLGDGDAVYLDFYSGGVTCLDCGVFHLDYMDQELLWLRVQAEEDAT